MIAAHLSAIETVFGKPAAIKVESHGQVILSKGEFDKPKNYFNGKLRSTSRK